MFYSFENFDSNQAISTYSDNEIEKFIKSRVN